ncbi:MAG: acetate--CoA ligase family protein [Microthrixaceae bacterium]
MSETLSESDSKALLSPYGIPFAPEVILTGPGEAPSAGETFGYPVAAKLCGDNIAHKTERGLVRLGLSSPEELTDAVEELLAAALPEDGATGVLVAPMIAGERELIAGIATDPTFGPTVLVGLGGVLAEAVEDVTVRLVPIAEMDAREMIEELRSQALLGAFRGEPPVDRDALVALLMGLSTAAGDDHGGSRITSADLNPLIIRDGQPVAVDALVELTGTSEPAGTAP